MANGTAPAHTPCPPHMHDSRSLAGMMRTVCIALAPALAAGAALLGAGILVNAAAAVLAAIASEALFLLAARKKITLTDGSAAVTGLLVAFNLPAGTPPWLAAAGGAFAIVFIKQLSGGMGANPFNPALGALAIMHLFFPAEMGGAWHSFSTAPPITAETQSLAPFVALLTGGSGATVAEVAAPLALCGGIFLLVRRVISWHIPIAFLAAAGATAFFLFRTPGTGESAAALSAGYHLVAGGLFLYAFFMATDPATSPVTAPGMVLFGACCGALVIIVRPFGGYPETAPLAMLLMNALAPLIDRITRPRVFGGRAAALRQKN